MEGQAVLGDSGTFLVRDWGLWGWWGWFRQEKMQPSWAAWTDLEEGEIGPGTWEAQSWGLSWGGRGCEGMGLWDFPQGSAERSFLPGWAALLSRDQGPPPASSLSPVRPEAAGTEGISSLGMGLRGWEWARGTPT